MSTHLQFAKPLIDFELAQSVTDYFTFTTTVHFHGSYNKLMNDERLRLFYVNDNELRKRFLMECFDDDENKKDYVEAAMKMIRVCLRSARILSTKNTFPCDLELSCPIVNTDKYPDGDICVHRSSEHVLNGLKLNKFQQEIWHQLEPLIEKIGMFSWNYLTYHERHVNGYFQSDRKSYILHKQHPLVIGLMAIKKDKKLTPSKSNKDAFRLSIQEYEECKKELVKVTDSLPVADGLFFQISRTCRKDWTDLDFLNELSSDEVVKTMHLNKAACLEVEFQFEIKYIFN